MHPSHRFLIVLHVRIPSILEGRDQQRYLERKLRGFGLRLRPPPTLAHTSIPAGYGLVRAGMGGWNVVEARGDVDANVTIIDLQQHELVEGAMDETAEDGRRTMRTADLAAAPCAEDDSGDENITAGGPMPGPLVVSAVRIGNFVLVPIVLAIHGARSIRRWYVREHG